MKLHFEHHKLCNVYSAKLGPVIASLQQRGQQRQAIIACYYPGLRIGPRIPDIKGSASSNCIWPLLWKRRRFWWGVYTGPGAQRCLSECSCSRAIKKLYIMFQPLKWGPRGWKPFVLRTAERDCLCTCDSLSQRNRRFWDNIKTLKSSHYGDITKWKKMHGKKTHKKQTHKCT